MALAMTVTMVAPSCCGPVWVAPPLEHFWTELWQFEGTSVTPLPFFPSGAKNPTEKKKSRIPNHLPSSYQKIEAKQRVGFEN